MSLPKFLCRKIPQKERQLEVSAAWVGRIRQTFSFSGQNSLLMVPLCFPAELWCRDGKAGREFYSNMALTVKDSDTAQLGCCRRCVQGEQLQRYITLHKACVCCLEIDLRKLISTSTNEPSPFEGKSRACTFPWPGMHRVSWQVCLALHIVCIMLFDYSTGRLKVTIILINTGCKCKGLWSRLIMNPGIDHVFSLPDWCMTFFKNPPSQPQEWKLSQIWTHWHETHFRFSVTHATRGYHYNECHSWIDFIKSA